MCSGSFLVLKYRTVRLLTNPWCSRGDLHSVSMSSETFNPEPTQQDTRECQQRKGNVTMSSTMQRQKEVGQLWAVECVYAVLGHWFVELQLVVNEQNRGLMLRGNGGWGVQCETKDVQAPYSLGNYQVLDAFSHWILSTKVKIRKGRI